VALGLGANIGHPRRQLLAAVAELSRRFGPLAVAPLYRSAPVSPLAQPDFLNSAVVVRTTLPPAELLALAKRLEREAGRLPGPRHGPRPLDVDLLVCGDLAVDEAGLSVPHPRLRERAFVLAPLAALAPDLAVPPDGRTVAELLAALPHDPTLRRVPWTRDAPPTAPRPVAAPRRR
jgi:2-amino-4-hydroxy-6-hydroxymethyldihydropteridine diphosphokinase